MEKENPIQCHLLITHISDPTFARAIEGNPMSRSSFASFHLTGIKPSGKLMTSSVDRLFENDSDVFISSNYNDFNQVRRAFLAEKNLISLKLKSCELTHTFQIVIDANRSFQQSKRPPQFNQNLPNRQRFFISTIYCFLHLNVTTNNECGFLKL